MEVSDPSDDFLDAGDDDDAEHGQSTGGRGGIARRAAGRLASLPRVLSRGRGCSGGGYRSVSSHEQLDEPSASGTELSEMGRTRRGDRAGHRAGSSSSSRRRGAAWRYERASTEEEGDEEEDEEEGGGVRAGRREASGRAPARTRVAWRDGDGGGRTNPPTDGEADGEADEQRSDGERYDRDAARRRETRARWRRRVRACTRVSAAIVVALFALVHTIDFVPPLHHAVLYNWLTRSLHPTTYSVAGVYLTGPSTPSTWCQARSKLSRSARVCRRRPAQRRIHPAEPPPSAAPTDPASGWSTPSSVTTASGQPFGTERGARAAARSGSEDGDASTGSEDGDASTLHVSRIHARTASGLPLELEMSLQWQYDGAQLPQLFRGYNQSVRWHWVDARTLGNPGDPRRDGRRDALL